MQTQSDRHETKAPLHIGANALMPVKTLAHTYGRARFCPIMPVPVPVDRTSLSAPARVVANVPYSRCALRLQNLMKV